MALRCGTVILDVLGMRYGAIVGQADWVQSYVSHEGHQSSWMTEQGAS